MTTPALKPPTLADAMNLQKVENNPLTADEVRMFEMFEREGWSFGKRRAFILAQTVSLAAE
jgi:hypothetical protein